jgi:putative OPT family oligopeptide transporter
MDENEKTCLGTDAYGGVDGEDYSPYVEHHRTIREFTLRAVIMGALVGIVFGAANAYIGLKVGMTVSASIPAAVIAIALARLWRSSVLENNMVQTVGSAGESLAAGVIFTIPALIVLGFVPALSKIFILSVIGGLLGVLFMVPLRRYLIVHEHGKLPYPEGTACAEVLVAGDRGGTLVKRVMAGVGIAGVYKFLMEGMGLWPYKPAWNIRGLTGARIGAEVTPALLGVGYVIGPKIAGLMLAGGAIGWLVIIPLIKMMGSGLAEPLFPATTLISDMEPIDIWDNYIRYIGAGAVVFGGVVTLIRAVPTIIRSFRMGIKGLTSGGEEDGEGEKRTARDLPTRYVVIGAVALGLLTWAVPQIPVNFVGALLIVIFSFFFVTVSSTIVGLIGSSSNPASGMTIATLLATSLVFLGFGWTGEAGMVAAISVGAVVCISICIAGDTSQDLKTGFLVGATPRRQQYGEIVGVLTSALVIGGVVFFLHGVYGIGSDRLPAPQAVLMSMVVKGVLTASLPWGLVFIGVFLAACIELLGVPSLPFAVGLYLPVRLSTPIMLGGVIRLFTERTRDPGLRHTRRERGVLYSSGLIAGGAIVGLAVAFLENAQIQRDDLIAQGEPVGVMTRGLATFFDKVHIGSGWAGSAEGVAALIFFFILAATLVVAISPRRGRGAPE